MFGDNRWCRFAWIVVACSLAGLFAMPSVAQVPYHARFGVGVLVEPVFMTVEPSDPVCFFSVQERGRTVIFNRRFQIVDPFPFLNIDPLVSRAGARGMLCLAFHPEFAGNRRIYVTYSENDDDLVLVAYRVGEHTPARGNPNSANILLTFRESTGIQDGARLGFGLETDGGRLIRSDLSNDAVVDGADVRMFADELIWRRGGLGCDARPVPE
jgi:hypothetical protein